LRWQSGQRAAESPGSRADDYDVVGRITERLPYATGRASST
jgi:hypothetical protein